MDENKLRRRWLRFGIRDFLWAIALLAIGLAWWLDHHQQATAKATWELRARQLAGYLKRGLPPHWSGDGLYVPEANEHGTFRFPPYPSTSLETTGPVEGPQFKL
jgi:hypothetical protein